ncbi:MAG: hypothetical protein SF187_09735 [Deltaproteobacteria bacterium]|nr:hypothetical protein [Deltaproteobacteria bacterium]
MFRETIQKVVEGIDGGLAGVLMGFDGISVDAYTKPQATTDINTVGMEFAHVLGQIRKAAELLEVGALDEVSLSTETLRVAIRVINEEYFVACVLGPAGNLAKARYLLRVSAPAIKAEL